MTSMENLVSEKPEIKVEEEGEIRRRIAKDFIYFTTNHPPTTVNATSQKPPEAFKNPWEDAVIFIVVLTLIIISIVILMTFLIIRLERTKEPEELAVGGAAGSDRSSQPKSPEAASNN